jgi:hypothetical protein
VDNVLQGFSQPMGGSNVPSGFAGGDQSLPQVLQYSVSCSTNDCADYNLCCLTRYTCKCACPSSLTVHVSAADPGPVHTQLVVAGQQPQQQPPPNLVLSGAPLQPEFGGGTTGTAGRMANHPIVVAGNTPPDPTQFGLVSAPHGFMLADPIMLGRLGMHAHVAGKVSVMYPRTAV